MALATDRNLALACCLLVGLLGCPGAPPGDGDAPQPPDCRAPPPPDEGDDDLPEDCGDAPTAWQDADADGFGDPDAPWTTCEEPGPGWADNDLDCDDGDPEHPAAPDDAVWVPRDFATLAEALAAADPGATVVLAEGEHGGGLVLDAPVSIRSACPGLASLVGVEGSPTLTLRGGLGRDTVVEGLLFEGGSAGAVLVEGSAPTIRGNRFVGNEAGRGGAVFVRGGLPGAEDHDGYALLADNVFEDNVATAEGGAVYAEDAGPVLEGNDCLGNIAGGSGGCAHLDQGAASVPARLDGGLLESNSAGGDGGAVWVCARDGELLSQDQTCLDNEAGGAGGGIAVRICGQASDEARGGEPEEPPEISISLVGLELVSNIAQGDGGAVDVVLDDLPHLELEEIGPARLEVIIQDLDNSPPGWVGNRSGGRGGAFHAELPLRPNLYGGPALEILDLRLEDNHAGEAGGALYIEVASEVAEWEFPPPVWEVRSVSVVANSTDGYGAGIVYDLSGLDEVEDPEACLGEILNEEMDVRENEAELDGGGLLFRLRRAREEEDWRDEGCAPAIEMLALSLRGNHAGGHGGGIAVEPAPGADFGPFDLRFEGSVVEENSSGGDGGAIYLGQPEPPAVEGFFDLFHEIVLEDVELSGNTAEGDGGALFADPGAGALTVNLDGVSLHGNETLGSGGGAALLGAWLVASDLEASANTALQGGGLYVAGGGEIVDSLFEDNGASCGGGLAFDRTGLAWPEEAWADLLFGNVFSGNGATGSGCADAEGAGGAGLLRGVPGVLEGNLFDGNSADDRGGALHILGGAPQLIGNTCSGNSAGDLGGCLSMLAASPVVVANTIAGNEAGARGGGLHVGDSSSLPTSYANSFDGNSAGEAGGGVYVEEGAGVLDEWGDPVTSCTEEDGNDYGLDEPNTPDDVAWAPTDSCGPDPGYRQAG